MKPPETGGVWTTVHTGPCVSSAPLLSYVTSFEATPQPKTVEFVAWLPKKEMLEIRPGDTTLKRARFQGGQVGVGEGDPQDVPGIAIHQLTMRRIHPQAGDADLRRKLIGGLRYETGTRKTPGRVIPGYAKTDLAKLVRDMARRAFRRPVTAADVQPYVNLATAALDRGEGFAAALRVGYRAVLCSPRFLYLTEAPGKLDAHAVAARLSYFLTGAPPDVELAKLADAGPLHDPQVLQAQARRLLAGAGGRRFVEDFAAEWLDLNLIDFTEPDTKLYPRFDSIVKNSMLDETHAHLGDQTRFPSLVLGLSGTNSPSYTENGSMIPAEESPARLFTRLFVDDSPNERARQAQRAREGRSIMDLVADDARALQRRLGAGDRDRLDAYFTGVRELERRLVEAEAWSDRPKPKVDVTKPVDIGNPNDFVGRGRLISEMIRLALSTDSTRFVSFHLGGSGGVVPIEGVDEGYHSLSHHGLDDEKLAQLALVETEIVRAWGDFLRSLDAARDHGGTLLDRTTVLLTSNLGNASSHDNRNMPVLIAGGGFRHTGHLAFDRNNNYPLPNLYLSMLQQRVSRRRNSPPAPARWPAWSRRPRPDRRLT